MLVQEIMTKHIISMDISETIETACKKYTDHKVGCLIITKHDHAVGIVTERDLIERALLPQIPITNPIQDIMTDNPKTIHPLANIEQALDLMRQHHIKKLPVEKNEHLIGIITLSDIAHAKPELTDRFMESWVSPRW